jgi:hypothetical protein
MAVDDLRDVSIPGSENRSEPQIIRIVARADDAPLKEALGRYDADACLGGQALDAHAADRGDPDSTAVHLLQAGADVVTNSHSWGDVLYDHDLAAAILDRALERGEHIVLGG